MLSSNLTLHMCVQLQEGKPDIYVSHGTDDAVLSIDYCSRRLVPRLQKQGYNVKYHEFDGPHTVPRDICQEGMHWFLGGVAISAPAR